jgi:hypothetical protein
VCAWLDVAAGDTVERVAATYAHMLAPRRQECVEDGRRPRAACCTAEPAAHHLWLTRSAHGRAEEEESAQGTQGVSHG